MSSKMSKRELQSPDRFMTAITSLYDWARAHPREVLVGGVVLAAVLVAIGLIAGNDVRVDPRAGAALSDALALADRPVVDPADAGAAEGEDVGEEEEASFPSETAKLEAIADALEKVRAEYPGTTSARTAILSLADTRFKLGQHEEALRLYDEFLARAPTTSSVRFSALEGRATALLALKRHDEALAAWEKLGAELPTFRDRALLGKATVFEAQERWNDARAAYEELNRDFPGSSTSRLGADRLASLNFRHPPVAPAEPAAAPTAADGAEGDEAAE